MRVIIAGSRNMFVEETFILELSTIYNILYDEVVSGTCLGIDRCGENFANKYHISLKKFPADWLNLGKSAGPIRNAEMAKYADALLLIWDGQSKGSANMKKEMLKLNKPVYEVIMKVHNVS